MPVLSTLGAATAKAWGFLQQVAAATDHYFEYVTMLLTGDGTNGAQNNTFLDSSTNNFTITRNGNTTQGSFSPYGANWGNYFNGSSYLSVADNAAFDYGSGDFTLECWINPTATNNNVLLTSHTSGANYGPCNLFFSSGALQLYSSSNNSSFDVANGASIGTPPIGQWSHVAVSRSGTSIRCFLNGTLTSTTTSSATLMNATGTFQIASRNGGEFYAGNVSNFRVVKGTALYTANFTPSTTPLTAVSGTSLLTCQSNRFIDNSSNAFAITSTGTPSVQRFSPFNPTASYDTATIGGSGYFDGSGDYLSVANNSAFDLGTNNFTIDCWVYAKSLYSTGRWVIAKWGASSSYGIRLESTGVLRGYAVCASGTAQAESSINLPLNAWSHIAFVRNGNTFTIFINGVDVGSDSTQSGSVTTTSDDVYVGWGQTSNRYWDGYISQPRIINGTALYTGSTYTVPTSPATAVSNTSLLLSCTNAGIPDSAMMNDLETVGNAQVSTSVKKFGTGSIAFDGTGDGLALPASNQWNFSSGDWTIEGWVYPTSLSGDHILVENTTDGTGGLSVQLFGSAFGVYINSTAINAGTFTVNTWQHFALVRSGSTMTAYINGTSVGTSSTTPGSGAAGLWIGARSGGGNSLAGYLDDLRITKGYARYTSNFTAPTAAFPTY